MDGFMAAESRRGDQRTLGVLIPAYNEESTIARVIRRVLLQDCVREVVVVDDGSTDGTLQAAKEAIDDPRVILRGHSKNLGKGAAIRTGLDAITTPIMIIQDADLEYDPMDYPGLIEPILQGRADVVYGVRGFAGQTAYSYWFVKGNQLVTTATNVLFNCYIQDMETGFKAIRTELMRRLGRRANRSKLGPKLPPGILRFASRIK